MWKFVILLNGAKMQQQLKNSHPRQRLWRGYSIHYSAAVLDCMWLLLQLFRVKNTCISIYSYCSLYINICILCVATDANPAFLLFNVSLFIFLLLFSFMENYWQEYWKGILLFCYGKDKKQKLVLRIIYLIFSCWDFMKSSKKVEKSHNLLTPVKLRETKFWNQLFTLNCLSFSVHSWMNFSLVFPQWNSISNKEITKR